MTEAEVEYGEFEKDPADTTAEPDKLEQENTSPDEAGLCQIQYRISTTF